MADHITAEVCLRTIPGEILVLRKQSHSQDNMADRSLVELGVVVDSFALEESSDGGPYRQLQLIRTLPGLELRTLDLLRTNRNVQSVSLNYTGHIAQLGFGDEWSSENGLKWAKLTPDLKLDQVCAAEDFAGKSVILSVDVRPEHAITVLESALRACEVRNVPIEFAAICCTARADLIGLYEYLKAFAKIQTLACKELAIILPVDFGRVCLHSDGGGKTNPLHGRAAVTAYSIPLFEQVMRICLRACAKKMVRSHKGYRLPAVFAAAGNREQTGGSLRWRLAYPALRPECVAVTHCDSTNGRFSPSSTSDFPIVHDTKPVFAVDESAAQRTQAATQGTSFAAPWLAGRLMSHNSDRNILQLAGPLARQAMLMARYPSIKLHGTVDGFECVGPALLIDEPKDDVQEASLGLTARLKTVLAEINDEFDDAEFAITGSAAALARSQDIAKWDDDKFAASPGDIDVVYSSENSLSQERLEKAEKWIRSKLHGVVNGEMLRIDIHDVDGRVAPLSLCQCIVPAAAMFLTQEGWIDVWGGVNDIRDRCIRILLPEHGPLNQLHPQSMAERHAKLPSLLVALNAALRLNAQSMKIFQVPTDLAADYAGLLESCIRLDGKFSLAPGTVRRLEKLAELLTRTRQDAFPLSRNINTMLSVIAQWIRGELPHTFDKESALRKALLTGLIG